MTERIISDEEVARYLREHPGFFELHADLLASITVPHPHGGRAISLQERQLEVLREKLRAHELRMAELLRIGQENDAITEKLQRWTRQLLLTADAVSPNLVAWQVAASVGMFIVLYAILFVLFIYLLNEKIQKGPESLEEMEQTPVTSLPDTFRDVFRRRARA